MRNPELRVGDDERERVAALLRDACAAGRLTIDELDDRLSAVYAARTASDLAGLTDDLPAAEAPAVQAPGRRMFWPGVRAFHERRHLSAAVDAAYEAALLEIVPRMGMAGFHLREETPPRRMTFATSLGLRVTVMFHPSARGGTDVSAFGEAPRAIRKAFAELRD